MNIFIRVVGVFKALENIDIESLRKEWLKTSCDDDYKFIESISHMMEEIEVFEVWL